MAGKNQVTLTFAGDSTKLTKAFDEVGSSARTMDTDVGNASKKISDSSSSFDRAGEAADGAEGKAQGFSDTLTGTKDVMGGVGEIAKGNLFEGFVMAGQGAADLAGGMASFLIPMGKTGILKAFAAGQALVNAVMAANPFLLVVLAIVALVAIFVVCYKKSETFRAIVQGAMKGIKAAFGWIIDKGKELVGWFKTLPGKMKGYFDGVVRAGAGILSWFQKLPGKIGGFFSGLGSTISKPFTSAFQGIRDFWNNTIGGKGFSIPDWVPKIGGKSFTIPYFHTGGIVPGGLGSETLAVLRAGERVTSGSNSGTDVEQGPIYLEAHIDLGNDVVKVVQVEMKKRDRNLKRTVRAA